MLSKKVILRTPPGLDVDPAIILAHAAEKCSSVVEIHYKNHLINAKSLLNILSVAIPSGARIRLTCTGPKEEEDLKRMIQTMERLGACTDDDEPDD